MRYIVSTTTHDAITGTQIDSWDGDITEADSREEASREAAKWEADLLRSDGADIIEVTDDSVIYRQDGEEFRIQIHVDIEPDQKGE